MRLVSARVQGYRCIADLTVDFDELTALIGTGGVGKSAFLRALEWFFDDTSLDEEDLHLSHGEELERAERLVVTVTFEDLSAADKDILGRYGGEPTTFTRVGRPGEASKLSGTALVCRAFDAVRAVSDGRKRKTAFVEFVEEHGAEFGFTEPLPNKIDEIDLLMEEFERANPTRCEEASEDASHLFGWGGGPKLRDRFNYVLVGATLDASDAMGLSRDSALSRLLSGIGDLDEDTEREVSEMQSETERRMQELIATSREPDLRRIGEAITEKVQAHVPGASVRLADEIVGAGLPKPKVIARVREGEGHFTEVARQGHGLQRAVVIAVLQALADTEAGLHMQEGESDQPRALMLALEEPELYQHPLQARALAGSLRALANVPSVEKPRSLQIAYSSHSPHFVRPALFENLRILRRGPAIVTHQVAGDSERVSKILTDAGLPGDPPGKMRKTLAASLDEAVFARVVLLCEGVSDAALLEGVAALEGGFDRLGIAVAPCWGKSILPLAYAILRQLEIPVYVFFDGDVGLDQRLQDKESVTDSQREAQLKASAEKNTQILRLCGDAEDEWPERAARAGSANFHDRLESDLAEIWPELAAARDQVAAELGIQPKSDQTYRQAVEIAGQPPAFLTDVLSKVRGLL
jgi:predicted ATP-dependent endonuclease of OLD family